MLNKYGNTGWKKIGLVSGLIDEAFSLNYIADIPPKADRNWFMLFISLFLYISWILGTVIGALSGSTVISEIKGIEFVMPALFIVIFISQWQKERSHGGSVLGLVVAVIFLPLFGKAYFMLPTMLFLSMLFMTRWLPFLIFKSGKQTPAYINYLGRVLPSVIFGMLVIYCYKDTDFLSPSHGVPEIASGLCVAVMQLLFKNMCLSIVFGTGVYVVWMNCL